MDKRTFVGRNKELSAISEWINRPNIGLVLITGAGGVGKTSVLQRISDEYLASNQFLVEYYDLAEQPDTLTSYAYHIGDTLKLEHFRELIWEIQKWEKSFDRQKELDEAVNNFIQAIAVYLKTHQKRLLHITDTFEITLAYGLSKKNWSGGLYKKLQEIPGSTFIIAGRDRIEDRDVLKEFFPLLENSFGKENILHISLAGFDKIEIGEFFDIFDSYRMIPQDVREKLHLLTSGRPVLLSLAVDWLQRSIPLPVLIEKSLLELQDILEIGSSQRDLLNSFEFELVSRVRELQSPIDIAVLFMAHLIKRMDSKLLSILLDMDRSEADETLDDLMKLSFVRRFIGSEPDKCSLHDEMAVLINKHAWKYLDISGEERKRLTQKAIEQYYKPRINELWDQKKALLLKDTQTTNSEYFQAEKSDRDRWQLEAEMVYYSTKISEQYSLESFDKMFYDKGTDYFRDQFLLDALKRGGFGHDRIALREADVLQRHGQIARARDVCLSVLKNDDLSSVDRIHGFITLGSMDLESNPKVARENFINALELANTRGYDRLQIILHNNLGRLYRHIGQLDAAIDHFKQAIEISRQSGHPERGITSRNNLASTYRLNGNLEEADVLCRLSIAENRKHGLERPLAYAYLAQADIDRDRGNLQGAQEYAELALGIFSRVDDKNGKAQVYRSLAHISQYSQEFEQALRYLRGGIFLLENGNSPRLLSSLYRVYGYTFRQYAIHLRNTENVGRTERPRLFEDALIALQKSIELAQQINNRWEIARSQLEIVQLTIFSHKPYDKVDLIELLDEIWQTANDLGDELSKGYVHENRARLELRNEKYFEAGREFGSAAWYFAKRVGQESTRASRRIYDVLLDTHQDGEQRSALANGILGQLHEYDIQDFRLLIALKEMCEQILYLST